MTMATHGVKYLKLQVLVEKLLEERPSLSSVEAVTQALKNQLIVERKAFLRGIGLILISQDEWGELKYEFKPSVEFCQELEER